MRFFIARPLVSGHSVQKLSLDLSLRIGVCANGELNPYARNAEDSGQTRVAGKARGRPVQDNQTKIEGKTEGIAFPLPRAAPRLPWAIIRSSLRDFSLARAPLRRRGSACVLKAPTSNFEEGISKVGEEG